MKYATFGKTTVELCPISGGVWFDALDLDEFLEAKEGIIRDLAEVEVEPSYTRGTDTVLLSPRNPLSGMQRHRFKVTPRFSIDSCPTTGGLWIDHCEIHNLKAVSRSEAMRDVKGRSLFSALAELCTTARENPDVDDFFKQAAKQKNLKKAYAKAGAELPLRLWPAVFGVLFGWDG